MAFDFTSLNQQYLTHYPPVTMPASQYNVAVTRNMATGLVFRCIGVHHLSSDENRGNHNIFLDVLDQNGHRIPMAEIAWGWDGMRLEETPRPAVIDKPPTEPGTNISLVGGQTVTVTVKTPVHPSDAVSGLHIRHPDEAPGNSLGHHSFYVVFQLRSDGTPPPPIEDMVVWIPTASNDPRGRGRIEWVIGPDNQIKQTRYKTP